MDIKTHQYCMQLALQQAMEALENDEVPVGCVITYNEKIIAAAGNQRETLKDPTAHAEIIAITQAAQAVGDWRLENCTMYVTLEPCVMCAGAIINARIPLVVYGATDFKGGAVHSLYQILNDTRLNHRSQVIGGILAQECGTLLSTFFEQKRMEKTSQKKASRIRPDE
ncbi:MAG TPA: tRNA adenosine(34) deaminase TadA [Pirellulaceae bacterium]|nr:tRNA adenosine(34) deaminase TadA [Pirellulaceae bacterium]HMO91995.1 tRNA adenosine(34) deaminase TadA [Pirellulaceae bacterium]HMP68794.1 tRNA adenosine(34) deaminase TadA [Pirellulaceae bacterium]